MKLSSFFKIENLKEQKCIIWLIGGLALLNLAYYLEKWSNKVNSNLFWIISILIIIGAVIFKILKIDIKLKHPRFDKKLIIIFLVILVIVSSIFTIIVINNSNKMKPKILSYYSTNQRLNSIALNNAINEIESSSKLYGVDINSLPKDQEINSITDAVNLGKDIRREEKKYPILIWSKQEEDLREYIHLTLTELLYKGKYDHSFPAETPVTDVKFIRAKLIPIFLQAYAFFRNSEFDRAMGMLGRAIDVANEEEYNNRENDLSEIWLWKGIIEYNRFFSEKRIYDEEGKPKYINNFKIAYDKDPSNCMALCKYACILDEHIITISTRNRDKMIDFAKNLNDEKIEILVRVKELYQLLLNKYPGELKKYTKPADDVYIVEDLMITESEIIERLDLIEDLLYLNIN